MRSQESAGEFFDLLLCTASLLLNVADVGWQSVWKPGWGCDHLEQWLSKYAGLCSGFYGRGGSIERLPQMDAGRFRSEDKDLRDL